MKILAIRGSNLASLGAPFALDLEHGPLAGVGLFAITGPVGAGKSTLLDALCLPLFDRTPRLSGRGGVPVGDDALPADDWLRSNDPRTLLRRDAAEGFAEVDFRGRDGRRYRARWHLRRARGRADGRLQEQQLSLHDLDQGVAVSTGRKTEVLAAIEQRLGLDFAQFCRSVLLAQGDFAAFLRAAPDERARLLENLTDAGIYRRLSKAVHERHRLRANDLAVLQGKQEAMPVLADELRRAKEAEAGRLAAEVRIGDVAVALATRYVNWHEALAQHAQREAEAVAALQAALAADAAAAPRRERLQRQQRALAALPRHEVATEAAAAAVRAAELAAAAAAAAGRSVAAQQAAFAALRQAMAPHWPGGITDGALPPLVADWPSWRPLVERLDRHERQLAAALAQLPRRRAALARAAAAVPECAAAVQRTASAQAAAHGELQAARSQPAADAEALAATAAQLRTQRLAADGVRRAAVDLAGALAELEVAGQQAAAAAAAVARADAAVAAAAAALGPARSAHEAAQRRREQIQSHQQLASLRRALRDGEPCPLCGAAEHPAAGLPVDADVAAAEAAVAQAEAKLVALREVQSQAQGDQRAANRELATATAATAAQQQRAAARRATLAEALRGASAAGLTAMPEADVAAASAPGLALAAREAADRWSAELAQQEGLLRTAEAAAAAQRRRFDTALQAAAVADRDAAQAVRDGDAAAAAQRTAEQELAAATAEAERLQQAVDELRDRLGEATHGVAGGREIVVALGADRLAQLDRWHELAARLATATAAAREAAQAAAAAAAESGRAAAARDAATQAFAKALALAEVEVADVVAAAELGSDGLMAMARDLQGLADEVTRRRAVLQERVQQRRAHEDHDRPTLDAAEAAAALADAQRHRQQMQQALEMVQADLRSDDAVRRARAELAPQLAAAEAELATWAALDELIGSSSGDAFAVFAQGLTLDLLLGEANLRLAELARRYRLQRNPGGELDFVVVDLDLGGSRRSLQTLSGGETFLVSLALALALATLAAPRARIETMFLDEGFGTLDAASLETALSALDALQADGCQVGVISHVEGIAERIGAQVEVVPEGGGHSRVVARPR